MNRFVRMILRTVKAATLAVILFGQANAKPGICSNYIPPNFKKYNVRQKQDKVTISKCRNYCDTESKILSKIHPEYDVQCCYYHEKQSDENTGSCYLMSYEFEKEKTPDPNAVIRKNKIGSKTFASTKIVDSKFVKIKKALEMNALKKKFEYETKLYRINKKIAEIPLWKSMNESELRSEGLDKNELLKELARYEDIRREILFKIADYSILSKQYGTLEKKYNNFNDLDKY